MESSAGDPFGCFTIPPQSLDDLTISRTLNIIACLACPDEGVEWDHASVTVDRDRDATPTWSEMCMVKDLFWDETECVVQFHPPKDDHINNHPGCLHLWKWAGGTLPMPPKKCV